MAYHIDFTGEARRHVRALAAGERARLLHAIREQLVHQPATVTRSRKRTAFIDGINRAWLHYQQHGGTSLEDVEREFGIKPKTKRRVVRKSAHRSR